MLLQSCLQFGSDINEASFMLFPSIINLATTAVADDDEYEDADDDDDDTNIFPTIVNPVVAVAAAAAAGTPSPIPVSSTPGWIVIELDKVVKHSDFEKAILKRVAID